MRDPTNASGDTGAYRPHPSAAEDLPRLAIAPPVLSGFLAVAAGVAVVIGGAALIPLSAAPGYVARLNASTAAAPVVVARGGRVATVHVRDGDAVKTGQLVISLDTAAILERGRQLRLQVEHTTRTLAAARRQSGIAGPGDEPEERAADAAERRAAHERVVKLQRDLNELTSRLADIDLDLLLTEVTAVADGRISGIAWLAAGATVASQSTVAVIEQRASSVSLDVAVPAALAFDIARGDIGRIRTHARLAGGADRGWPLPGEVVDVEPATAKTDAGTATGTGRVRVSITDQGGTIASTHRPGDAVGRVTFDTGETRSLLSELWTSVGRQLTVFLKS